MQSSIVGIGIADVDEIDSLNILQATMLAMTRAVCNLSIVPNHCLIDGNQTPKKITCNTQSIVKGDSKSLSIAAASIVAKVYRDNIMLNLSDEFPQYYWHKNSGYGTKQHREAINQFGITKHHRKSFRFNSSV